MLVFRVMQLVMSIVRDLLRNKKEKIKHGLKMRTEKESVFFFAVKCNMM